MSIWVPLARPHRAVPGAERRKAVKVVLNSKVHYALNGTAISRAASKELDGLRVISGLEGLIRGVDLSASLSCEKRLTRGPHKLDIVFRSGPPRDRELLWVRPLKA